MLTKRVLTAIIGILVAYYVINHGQGIFVAVVGILALVAWHEYSRMLALKQFQVWYMTGHLFIALLVACAWLGNSQELVIVIMAAVVIILAKSVIKFDQYNIIHASLTLFGVIYIGFSFMHLVLLRFTAEYQFYTSTFGTMSAGAVYIWLAFLITWGNDTFAYITGSMFGKRKLCPSVSPGKTVEGVAGGFLGSIVLAILFGYIFQISYLHSFIIGILTGIAAPLGDLAESAIKRFCGVKDSSNILPGHGGVLDRFDSIMFVVPFIYYYIQVFVVS